VLVPMTLSDYKPRASK